MKDEKKRGDVNLKDYTFWDEAELPVVVGVSAHRKINSDYIDVIKEEVKRTLFEIRSACPHSPVVMLNGLAEGGDLLCAEAAIELGIDIYAVIPFDEEEYVNDRDFSPEAKNKYREIKKSVKRFFTAPDTEKCECPPEQRRNYLFRQQSIYVSSKCHVLLALWDGDRECEGEENRASAYPCGASAAVNFALFHNFRQPYGNEFFSSYDGAVVKISAPRAGKKYMDGNWEIKRKYLSPKAPDKEADKMPKELKEVIIRTDLSTKDYGKYLKGCYKKLKGKVKKGENVSKLIQPDDTDFLIGYEEYAEGGEALKKMHDCYKVASKLSRGYKDRFLKNLKWLSLFGLLLLLGFMFYDQFAEKWTVIAFLVLLLMLFAAFVCVKVWEHPNLLAKLKMRGGRCDRHTKFIEYRALAETLRVQYYLTAYGVYYDAGNYFTWSHKNEVIWIKKAVTAVFIGAKGRLWQNENLKKFYSTGSAQTVVFDDRDKAVFADRLFLKWVGKDKVTAHKNANGQVGYHLKTRKEAEAKIKKRKCWGIAAAVFTILAYIALMIAELADVVELSRPLFWVVNLRMIFKIVISVLAAITFLLSYYYGKLSLERNEADSENMINLFSIAIDRAADIFGGALYLTDESKNEAFCSLLKALAREQVTENGMWIAYNRENGTDFPL